MLNPKLKLSWAPRIICIVAILFISLFALDSFTPNLSFWQQIQAFLIHLIPSLLLTAILIIAWKWELVGGILLLIIGLGFSPPVFFLNYNRNHSRGESLLIILLITFPFVISGFLFVLSYYRNKRKAASHSL